MFRQMAQFLANESATYVQQKLDVEEEQRQDFPQLPSFAAKFDESEDPKIVEKCKALRDRFIAYLFFLFVR